MRPFISLVRGGFVKEMRLWRRSPRRLFLVVLLPIMYYAAFVLLMGGVYYGGGVDTGLVVEEENPGTYTNGLIEILGQHDPIPPRLNPIVMDAATAESMFDEGALMLVLTIPDGFENALATNGTTSIHIRVNNYHEDVTKNLEMPVIRKLDIFYQTYLPGDAKTTFDVEVLYDITPPRLAYMAWTITLYAITFGATFVAGSSMTREFEEGTMDELRLSNQAPHGLFVGKMLGGVVLSYIAVPVLFTLAALAFGVWPYIDPLVYLMLSLPLAFFCSGIGIVLGSFSRNSVYTVPLSAMLALFYWLTGGGLASLSILGLSFGTVNEYLPFSNAYRSTISMFIDATYDTLLIDFSVVSLAAVVMTVIAPVLSDHISRLDLSAGPRVVRWRSRTAKLAQG